MRIRRLLVAATAALALAAAGATYAAQAPAERPRWDAAVADPGRDGAVPQPRRRPGRRLEHPVPGHQRADLHRGHRHPVDGRHGVPLAQRRQHRLHATRPSRPRSSTRRDRRVRCGSPGWSTSCRTRRAPCRSPSWATRASCTRLRATASWATPASGRCTSGRGSPARTGCTRCGTRGSAVRRSLPTEDHLTVAQTRSDHLPALLGVEVSGRVVDVRGGHQQPASVRQPSGHGTQQAGADAVAPCRVEHADADQLEVTTQPGLGRLGGRTRAAWSVHHWPRSPV